MGLKKGGDVRGEVEGGDVLRRDAETEEVQDFEGCLGFGADF